MNDKVLEVEGLYSGYLTGDILQGVDLAVSPGEIVAVVGRNGAGKTTLMKTVMGLLPARKGTVRFRGQDITQASPERRAHEGIGFVPQGRMIFSDLTVRENLRMGERINVATPSNYEIVFEYFPHLRERLRQSGGTLSGGEQQALAIGRALVGQPYLLLLDEPSEGIQPSIILQIGDVLRRLNADKGMTIVIVEQNLGLIERVAHRGYVIEKGKTTERLTVQVLHDRTAMLKHLSV